MRTWYIAGRDEMFAALRNWVENGVAPVRIDVSSSDSSVSMPLCPYPQKAIHVGAGARPVGSQHRRAASQVTPVIPTLSGRYAALT